MLRTLTAAAMLAAAPAAAHDAHEKQAGQDWPFEVVNIAPNLFMLEGRGGNVGVLTGDDRTFIIDDKFADNAEQIRAAIQSVEGNAVGYVVNTHWHGDHTGGNASFGDQATIIAHENVRQRLSTDQQSEIFDRSTPASPEEAWPVVTFTRDVTLHLNGQTAHVEHIPNAHTDGDAVIYFTEADVLHMGDIFFNQSFPFIDTSSGGSIDGFIAGLARGLEIAGEDTTIMPGHGPLATRADLQAAHDLAVMLRDRVQASIDAGLTLEETLADNPLADLDEDYAGFMDSETLVNILYPDLTEGLSAQN